jgi:ABC-type antimicrobial peptide transport system permease subunit
MRREVASLDPSLAVFDFETVQDLVDDSLATNRIITRIVSAFSVMALVLAAVGVYGVVLSTFVPRFRNECALR